MEGPTAYIICPTLWEDNKGKTTISWLGGSLMTSIRAWERWKHFCSILT